MAKKRRRKGSRTRNRQNSTPRKQPNILSRALMKLRTPAGWLLAAILMVVPFAYKPLGDFIDKNVDKAKTKMNMNKPNA